jgi:hypothetical protein
MKVKCLISGARYTVRGTFYAAQVSRRRIRDEGTLIPEGSVLTILPPYHLPRYPGEKPPKRVLFSLNGRHYWQFEKEFLERCRVQVDVAERFRTGEYESGSPPRHNLQDSGAVDFVCAGRVR